MVNQVIQSNSLTTNNLISQTVKDLTSNLQALQPSDNRTAQLITYALVATAITGIMVYHYIRNQENLD